LVEIAENYLVKSADFYLTVTTLLLQRYELVKPCTRSHQKNKIY